MWLILVIRCTDNGRSISDLSAPADTLVLDKPVGQIRHDPFKHRCLSPTTKRLDHYGRVFSWSAVGGAETLFGGSRTRSADESKLACFHRASQGGVRLQRRTIVLSPRPLKVPDAKTSGTFNRLAFPRLHIRLRCTYSQTSRAGCSRSVC
jgi:hypothetical protein